MVNTRSEANRASQDDRNAREEGNSNDPQLTRMNERIEQMAKSIEDLATMNAILQVRVPELHRTVTDPEVQEVHNSHIGGRREEERLGGNRVKESGERNNQEEIPVHLPPPQTETERAVQGMITRLEQRCNVLTAAIEWNDKGKASLVENLLQKTTSPFTEDVANIRLPEKFKILEIPFYTGLEDLVEHLDPHGPSPNARNGSLSSLPADPFG